MTPKRVDFVLFSKVIEIVNCKKHLTQSGLQDIVNIKASLNIGLSESLRLAFPNTIAVKIIETKITASINSYLVLPRVRVVFSLVFTNLPNPKQGELCN